MIRRRIHILLFLAPVCLFSQQRVVTDTLYIARNFNSYITFGKPIQKINFGANVFAVMNGKMTPDFISGRSIVTVKAKKRFKQPTNITAISKDFTYYNLICQYTDKQPKKIFYFFDVPKRKEPAPVKTQPVAEEAKEVIVEEAEKQQEKEALLQEHFFVDTLYYKAQAKKINTNHKLYGEIKRRFVSQDYITLQLIGTYARKDKIYIKFNIKNNSPVPFDIAGWNFVYSQNEGWNAQTLPEQEIFPIYEYSKKFQSVLPERSMNRTFVFEKFALRQGKYLAVQLHEKNSEREIELKIHSRYINSPIPLQKHWDRKTLRLIKEQEEKEKNKNEQQKKKQPAPPDSLTVAKDTTTLKKKSQ